MYRYRYYDKYNMKLLIFERLENAGVKHCFTTRHGGVSSGACGSLNMSRSRDSDVRNVEENIRRLAESLDVDYNKVTAVPQVHGCKIKAVDLKNCGAGVSKESFGEGYDGMITNIPGITLMTLHGDCVPVFLYECEKKAVGMVHSGWRGTAERIAACAVYAMSREYGTDPANVYAAIGPSIDKDCFEVDHPVYEKLLKAFPSVEYDRTLAEKQKNAEKWNISLPELAARALIECGVKRENIDISGICTCCAENAGDYFSHRRSKGADGIMAGAICLGMRRV